MNRPHSLRVCLEHPPILGEIAVDVPDGAKVAIIGPNGAGKTTLLRLMAGLLKPKVGTIFLDGIRLSSLTRGQVAQKVAFLSQPDVVTGGFGVRDYIGLGRLPYRGVSTSSQDRAVTEEAAVECGVAHLVDRDMDQLSGGERQRVMLARCLAQEPGLLLLDEPTNHLDLSARASLLGLLRELPVTVIAVLHDLELVQPYFDRSLVLHQGRIAAQGKPSDVLVTEVIAPIFGLAAHHVLLDNKQSTIVIRAIH